jgi:hypothetical protein
MLMKAGTKNKPKLVMRTVVNVVGITRATTYASISAPVPKYEAIIILEASPINIDTNEPNVRMISEKPFPSFLCFINPLA